MDHLLQILNAQQRAAVVHPPGKLLVLAGAGSGKTRVLVHRIGFLLQQGVELGRILAVTFTNKAAREMKLRLERMLERSLQGLWIGTFHGLANQLLRRHYEAVGLGAAFQILDTEDQLRLLKRVHRDLNLDNDKWLPKQSQYFINQYKEAGVRAREVEAATYSEEVLREVYVAYEELCRIGDLVDFSELLLRSYELLTQNVSLQQFYQEKFQHILVDEFQDTNVLQYRWIKNLAVHNLVAVGDDDQSIYSWRGADSANLKHLQEDYPQLKVIRLEQNYRSSGNVLSAANAVISYNRNRLGKELWTEAAGGEQITVYRAFNEVDEANFIALEVKKWLLQGRALSEMAVLYRSNAQSRVLEEQMLRHQINYQVYGGMRFFERSEIKDILAYLRLLLNSGDDAAFERVINLPNRGLGEVLMTQVRRIAKERGSSLWQAMEMVATQGKSKLGWLEFVAIFEDLKRENQNLGLADLVIYLINRVKLLEYYAKPQALETYQTRKENLDEFVSAIQQFSGVRATENNMVVLQTFLTEITLETERETKGEDALKLMTLHAAKGLEFTVVFIVGMEEGLFPHAMSMKEQNDLEEERRLCYVGMTRAKEKLYLIHAETRQIRGVTGMCKASRFLQEVPLSLIQGERVRERTYSQQNYDEERSSETDGWKVGQKVRHQSFGEGVIRAVEGNEEFRLLKVVFRSYGEKTLSPKYAKLERL